MYQDYIWFIVAAGLAAFILLLIAYLIASRKTGKQFARIKKQNTEPFDPLSITASVQAAKIVEDGKEAIEAKSIHIAATDVQAEKSETFSVKVKSISNFDSKILDGKYSLLGELQGGGMGRIFLALKAGVENKWIIKYVPRYSGGLSNEADILKKLNHHALPQIIDIFEDSKGLYLAQSFIPGESMKSVLESFKIERIAIPELRLLDWAEQLTEVLSHLHTRERPIYHFDLKPSNIMVSRGNKLMLIDFGISRRQSDTVGLEGFTIEYAAPEQIKELPRTKDPKKQEHFEAIIAARFGGFGALPDVRMNWPLDARTDIYSLGAVLFEAIVGEIPTIHNCAMLQEHISKGMCDIINKCLETDPSMRYQTADELMTALHCQKGYIEQKGSTTLLKRRAAKWASVPLMLFAIFSLASGMFVRAMEVAAAMYVNPEIITVSLLQSSEVQITRVLPEVESPLARLLLDDDPERPVDPNQLRWEVTASHIAQVDGNRILGLNVGETLVHGQYRMQDITLRVNVVEPMDGMVDISMRYGPGHIIQLFAGTSHRERIDGNLPNAEFVSPESMSATQDGVVYFADAGWLRRIQNGMVETVDIGPMHLRAHLVRTHYNDIYILTHTWQDDDDHFHGIMRHTANGHEMLYTANSQFTSIRDFVVADERIYFIERNDGVGLTYLRVMDRHFPDDVRTLAELPEGTSAITIGGYRIYLADEAEGTLLLYENGQLVHLAGLPGEHAFIDGAAPLFYRPTRIHYHDSALHVWDFNVLRKVYLEDGVVRETISLAGMASPEFSMDFEPQEQAERIVLPYSRLADFVIMDGGILLSDPIRGVVWWFE